MCVFCGSNDGARPEYRRAAVAVGRALAESGLTLVYGGAHVGLMGAMADAALEGGGAVIGVIPRGLELRELAHPNLTELHVVETMHERKAKMAALAGAFLALPGGLGTLDEFFEILTWAQLGIHRLPCLMLNTEGYFDTLLKFLETGVEQRFVQWKEHARIHLATQPAEVVPLLRRLWRELRPAEYIGQPLPGSETGEIPQP